MVDDQAVGRGSGLPTRTGGVMTACTVYYSDGISANLVQAPWSGPWTTANGILALGAVSNLVLNSSDLTKQATYTATNCTTVFGATGPTGLTDATTITATDANATVTQAITSTAGVRITSCWIKRRTGIGTISLTNWGSTTWEPVTVTSAWTRVNTAVSGAGASNPTVGIQIATSGDAVDVFALHHEKATFVTPATLVTGAVAGGGSITAMSLTYPASGNVPATGPGTIAGTMTVLGSVTVALCTLMDTRDAGGVNGVHIEMSNTSRPAFAVRSAGVDTASITAGAGVDDFALGVPKRLLGAWAINDSALYSSGILRGTDTACDVPVSHFKLTIGANVSGGLQSNGPVRGIEVYSARLR
jgi:hypothetical protein